MMQSKVKIKHDKHGEVDEVEAVWYSDASGIEGWIKDGAMRFQLDGWREVKPTRRDVTGDIEIENLDYSTHFASKEGRYVDLEPSYHFEKVTMYDLPEGWDKKWFSAGLGLTGYVDQFKRPCIIITKEE